MRRRVKADVRLVTKVILVRINMYRSVRLISGGRLVTFTRGKTPSRPPVEIIMFREIQDILATRLQRLIVLLSSEGLPRRHNALYLYLPHTAYTVT